MIFTNRHTMALGLLLLLNGCNAQNRPDAEQRKTLEQARSNFVFVKGGRFMMGLEEYYETSPVHEVTLDGFSISKYETTFKEYDLYCILTDQDIVRPERRHMPQYGENYGAKQMTWQQARDYCNWLGEQLALPIDLPTEAQWEYAARSRGLDVAHGTDSGEIEGSFTEKRNYPIKDTIVGAYPPNPLGLYDMSGGRPEWVLDWLVAYPDHPITNPFADSVDVYEDRVVRGVHTLVNSVYNRASREPDSYKSGVGFRCVCNQKTPIAEPKKTTEPQDK